MLKENFENEVGQQVAHLMYDRFKIMKLDESHKVDPNEGTSVFDFIVGLNIISRIVYDRKLKLLFELCDDDDDGSMPPKHLQLMMKSVEKIFSQDPSRQDRDSIAMNDFIAEKKAE